MRLRPVTEADRPFLLELYGSVRAEELEQVAWSAEARAAFVAQQFEAQDTYYRAHYPGASFDVIEVAGRPAGRLYVARWPVEIRIVDIALAPGFRGRGNGTRLLEGLLAEATAAGRTLTIHVEVFNRARVLYERLGFAVVAERGAHLLMAAGPSLPVGAGYEMTAS